MINRSGYAASAGTRLTPPDQCPGLGLMSERQRHTLQVSRDRMLAEPWWFLQDQGREALTQALGRLAREHGFVALLVPSAARPRGTNVVVYPDRITANDRLAIVNAERLPPGTA
jgi:RES domain